MDRENLLEEAKQMAAELLKDQIPPELVFHNYAYTERIANSTETISKLEKLEAPDSMEAVTTVWLHALGYTKDYAKHKEASLTIAENFLEQQAVSKDLQQSILDGIQVLNGHKKPETTVEKVLNDAKQAEVSESGYTERIKLLEQEKAALTNTPPSELDSLQSYLEEVSKYEYHTTYGKEILLPAREDLKKKLEKRIKKLQKSIDENLSIDLGVTAEKLKALKKKLQKVDGRSERGVETMFRLTSKNHIDLSGMADSKANIMISINSIIISVLLGGLMNKLDTNPHLVYPTIILLCVNLGALIFAILSLRPNISDGKFTEDDIENQTTNLLFFGNFHKMKRADYHWGMNKLMENSNFLYSNLIDDIYFLGVVLARKYKLLRISYNIFMIGMVIAVVAFIISLNYAEQPLRDAILDTLQNQE